MTRRSTVGLVLLGMTVGMVVAAEEDTLGNRLRTARSPLLPKVHITEICVIPPQGKNWPSWVELWNNANTNMDVTGYSLSTLQATYKPFLDKTVLQPNERLVLLFYAGDKKDDGFEKTIPAAVQKVRVFSTTAFPPYRSQEQWIARLSDSFKESVQDKLKSLPPADRDAKLAAHASFFVLSTRFVNELALRAADGTLVGYVAWGDKRSIDWGESKQYTPTASNQEAIEKGFLIEYRVPHMFRDGDSECAVLQLLAPLSMRGDLEDEHTKLWRRALSGFYYPLTHPEGNCSPGTPMKLDVKAPELLPVKPCGVGDVPAGRCVFLNIGFREGITDPIFERPLGWSRELCEICYDREMKKPVFKPDINQFTRSLENGLWLPLRPSVYRQLDGKTVYVRASKHHKQKGALYSDIQEVRISHDGREPIPQEPTNTNITAGMVELADSAGDANSMPRQVEPSGKQAGGAVEANDFCDESEHLP